MTETQRAACSELAHAAELLLGSKSDAVQAAGVMLITRIPLIIDGHTDVYLDSDEDLQAYVDVARQIHRNSENEESPGDSETPV